MTRPKNMGRSSTADKMSVTILCLGIPPSANTLMRKHWSFRDKAVKEWQRTLYYTMTRKDMGWLQRMAQVGKEMEVDILFRHNAEFDEPEGLYGACKVVIDALVNNGFLKSDKNLKLHPHQEKVRAKETRIRICEAAG